MRRHLPFGQTAALSRAKPARPCESRGGRPKHRFFKAVLGGAAAIAAAGFALAFGDGIFEKNGNP